MTPRAIVLDANVLMRGVLGRKVDRLIDQFAPSVTFLAPDVALDDVREHLAAVLTKRDELHALQACLDKLEALQRMVRVVDESEYLSKKPAALERIGRRDPDDWPVLAD
ncbi:MAG TPA: PIN domain-containing protein [Burkholderiaceae bacterium]|nr:PIN domain-containing protein [Burkholderiaceae bacterium]HMX09794.1 PIN domain-containing protein [Burkholderiaceae bacterium]HNB43414.1 PIN domain-containing protein [Burkholderiaceae bacterium]HNG78890.1 PIN domain-containing protein [Burkholderiaceae bacterium]